MLILQVVIHLQIGQEIVVLSKRIPKLTKILICH